MITFSLFILMGSGFEFNKTNPLYIFSNQLLKTDLNDLILMSSDKEWYFLDEPFSGVDLERKNLMIDIINEKIIEK